MRNFSKNWLLLIAMVVTVYTIGCRKIELVTTTTEDVNIYDYLKRSPEKFSGFVSILDKAGYADFLNAYGSYTLFAPTNEGVQTYLKNVNKASVDQLTEAEAQSIVKLHLIEDTINTVSFKDGKLPQVTMYGQYLLAGVTFKDGTSSYSINRQALVTQSNINTGNGIIHVLNNVLTPATKNLSQLIEDNPIYSIFTQALKETGYYDTLSKTTSGSSTRWLTVLAETNTALKDSGINSYADLKAKYSQTGNPANAKDSLHLYVAYHILPDAKYLADIVTSPSHNTLAPLEVITSKLEGQTVLINDIQFNGQHEQGVQLEREASDNAATNGVLHKATSHFAIKIRKPIATYWDVAEFEEIKKLPAYYGKKNYVFEYGSIKDIQWEKNSITYAYTSASNFPVYKNDYLMIPLGTQSARNLWVEFTTPLLVKGRYKVWICYRQQRQSTSSTAVCQASFNGDPLSRVFDFTQTVPAGTPGELEALGWKLYAEASNNYMAGRLLGTIDVKSTDRHTLRLQCISGGQNNNNIDMIHFIPVDMNQISPRFTRDGNTIP